MEKFTADRIVTINVDVQNDFMPGGALAVPQGDEVISPLNELNTYTREHNGLVVATGDQHPTTTPHFDKWPVHCVAGTEGAALDARLDIKTDDIIVDKGTEQTDGYSAFEGKTRDGHTLESLLTPARRERVAALFGGVATEYCVLNSVLDAAKIQPHQGELRIYVVEDAVRGINEQDTAAALAQMSEAGAIIIESKDVLTQRAIELAQ